jgi:hypothetical protein
MPDEITPPTTETKTERHETSVTKGDTTSEPETFRNVFTDKAFLITLVIMFQFFFLIIYFSAEPSQMATDAKNIILQAYVVAFSAGWGFWIGSSHSSQQKDKIIAKGM